MSKKKTFLKRMTIIIVYFALFCIVGCNKNSENLIPLDDKTVVQDQNCVLGNLTRVIGYEWEKHIIGVVTDSIITLASSSALELPKVGEILIKPGITDKFPCGFLGKIIEIKQDGNNTKIITKRIELTEAFKELTIHFNNDVTTKAWIPIKDIDKHINPSFSFKKEYTGTLINKDREKSFASASGYFDIGGQLFVDIVIHNHKWEYQRYGLKLDATIGANIEAKLLEVDNKHIGQIKVYTHPFGAIPIGPIVVVPEYAVYFGMKAEGSIAIEGELEYSASLIIGCERYGDNQWQKLESDKSTPEDKLFKIKGKLSGLIGVGIINDFRAMVYDVSGPDVKEQNLLALRAEFECDAAKAVTGELYDAFKESKGELLAIIGGGVGVVAQIPFTNLEFYWEKIWDKEFSIAKWPLLPEFGKLETRQGDGNTMEVKYTLTSGNTLFRGQYGIVVIDKQNIITKQYYNIVPLKISELGTAVPVFTVFNVPKEAYVCPVYKLWDFEFVDYKSRVRFDGLADDGLTYDIHNIIPREYLEILRYLGLEIFGGNNPPNIEGTYLATPLALIRSNATINIAEQWDMYVTFAEQDNASLTVNADYSMTVDRGRIYGQAIMSSRGPGSFIVGDGNKFTVFVDAVRTEVGYTAKTVEVFSGEMAPDGIKNYQWAVIMVNDNGGYPGGGWISNGTGYVKRDSDGFSERINPIPPEANFSIMYQTQSGQVGPPPCVVAFTNSTETRGLSTTYIWTINGTQISTNQNTSYTFNSSGSHTIRLTATNSFGSHYVEKVVTIPALTLPVANFSITYQTSNGQIGPPPCPVTFTNTTTTHGLVTNYRWTVNGTQISTSQNTSYTFSSSGTHTIRLTATNSHGSHYLERTVSIPNPSTATVTLREHLALSDGLAYSFSASNDVKEFYWTSFKTSDVPQKEEDIIAYLLSNGVYATRDNIGGFGGYYYGLEERSNHTLCIIAFDTQGRRGVLYKTQLATKTSANQPEAKINIRNISNRTITYDITRNSYCDRYLLAGWHGFDEELLNYPDIFWAARTYFAENRNDFIQNQNVSSGTWGGWAQNSFCILITLGYDRSGNVSAVINKQAFSTATNTTRSLSSTVSNTKSNGVTLNKNYHKMPLLIMENPEH